MIDAVETCRRLGERMGKIEVRDAIQDTQICNLQEVLKDINHVVRRIETRVAGIVGMGVLASLLVQKYL